MTCCMFPITVPSGVWGSVFGSWEGVGYPLACAARGDAAAAAAVPFWFPPGRFGPPGPPGAAGLSGVKPRAWAAPAAPGMALSMPWATPGRAPASPAARPDAAPGVDPARAPSEAGAPRAPTAACAARAVEPTPLKKSPTGFAPGVSSGFPTGLTAPLVAPAAAVPVVLRCAPAVSGLPTGL